MSCTKTDHFTPTGFYGKSAYGFYKPQDVDTRRVINPQSTPTHSVKKEEGFGHATKKMFHSSSKNNNSESKYRSDMSPSNPNNTYFTNQAKHISEICKSSVKRDGFCDNITSDMYVHKKKRVKEYEKNIGLREYLKTNNRRVLKEGNDTKKQYDRLSQIVCLGGNQNALREEPKKNVKNLFNSNSTADIYMNQHVWNRNIFTNNQDRDLKKQKENLIPKDKRTGSLSKLQATTPELEHMGIWRPTRPIADIRKKSNGKYNTGMLHQTSPDINKTYFGAAIYQTHKNWDHTGKKRNKNWEKARKGGTSTEMRLIPAKREAQSAKKKIDFLTGSIPSFT